MTVLDNELYLEDVRAAAALPLPWERLKGKSLLISGATGMIGSVIVDIIMSRPDLECRVIALGRNADKAKARFGSYFESPLFSFISADINDLGSLEQVTQGDFIIHAASNTHPMAYSTDPIGTISSNIIGTDNLLRLAEGVGCERFVFVSSVEIYGENRGDTDRFDERYCGYIDCNTLRAGYPEGKRAGEALCQAYIRQKDMDCVVPRLSRVYGPTMLMSDTKALSQFIKKGIAGEDIVLKSEGTQLYSYTYAVDAASALLTVMLVGEKGVAYNISDENSDIMLRDLAKIIADYAGKQVVFELPDEVERAGYSTATKATLDNTRLLGLGWKARYDIRAGLPRTLDILKTLVE